MVTPVFRIFDYAKAIEFYIDWLDFKIDWEDRPADGPVYLQVSRGDVVLHLSGHHGDGSPGATARAEVRGLAAYHTRLLHKNYPYMRPALVPAPWNARVLEMAVLDPFSNRLIFCDAVGVPV
ncbi:glyoxalase superfamily protein [Hymenobacter caeli]|uniref:Catechol 2,3-dioxygenase-like lactoylglutathione lyase family enzyme n=1 Tax=Hymenobacter caeli TaxID=2735894 RepID=A0ABX2FPW8_9BACT|nr:glyoxalase superfamily protein [Hymenobacter caeli]NRT18888.1 catechol 2,3-dioxygenase-like lactoylglutathione lyase family enzyme [Hymenobacter caeli]